VNGEVTIAASTSIGLSRGLTTLSQLFYKHSKGGSYTPFAPVNIQDKPVFPYRGFNIDLSRSFFEKRDIMRTIDALAMSKFNVLHLHMTDSQSWPLEITSMPELSQKGAYRKDLAYSPEAIKDIQDYGALRGIQVYLEIDMPGHTAAIWYSHPELIANFNVQPWTATAAEPPTGVLKLNEPKVYDFVAKLFSDLLPRLSPYTAYFHTGGDELKYDAYLYDETVKSNNPAVLKPLVQKLVDHSHGLVRSAGLTPIVWEEMILSWNLTLGQDTIVQAWNEDSAVASIVGKGYRALGGLAKYWVSHRSVHVIPASTEALGPIVSGLWLRRVAQLRQHCPEPGCHGLVQPAEELEDHVQLQPARGRPRREPRQGDWWRGARMGRAGRRNQPRLRRVAAGGGGRRGSLERAQ
jgi:hexosaminidase